MYCPVHLARDAERNTNSSSFRFGSTAPWVHEIHLQPIVNRQECIIGYEALARFRPKVFGSGVEEAIGTLSLSALRQLTSEVLLGLRMRCLLEKKYAKLRGASEPSFVALRHFVNVEKVSLTDSAVVDELIESAADLRSSGACLVVEVTERPVPTSTLFKAYLKGLMRLKQEEILIALDDYDLNSTSHWELELGLCDVVKLDLASLGIVAHHDEDCFTVRHAALADQLFGVIDRYRVELIAEKVETDRQYEIVKGLPFKFFQGYLFGRPQRTDVV